MTQAETFQQPLVTCYDQAFQIASGYYVPGSYEEFRSFQQYVAGFVRENSSINDRAVYSRFGERIHPEEYQFLRRAADPRYWLLSENERQGLEEVLQDTSLPTDNDEQKIMLLERQENAHRRLSLDSIAREMLMLERWAASRHAVRHGLGPHSTPEEIRALRSTPLDERLRRVGSLLFRD